MDNTAEITCSFLTTGIITSELSSSQSISAELSSSQSISAELIIPEIVEKTPESYNGTLSFTPAFYDQMAYTANKVAKDDVHISAIQTFEVSNDAGGLTFII